MTWRAAVLVLLWALISLPRDSLLQRSQELCLTFDGRAGLKVEIRACKVLVKRLNGNKPSREQIAYVKQFQVGWKGSTPIVCCPSDEDDNSNPEPDNVHVPVRPATTPPTTTPKAKPSPPPKIVDVEGHPNQNLLPEVCGVTTGEKIFNGEKTKLFEYPWMALLGFQTDRGIQYLCGGSLINSRYVLTAAHCVVTQKNKRLAVVRLGEYDLDSTKDCQDDLGCAPPVQDIVIEKATRHPQFNEEDLQNDIALLRLKKPANMTKGVKPICLPIGEEQMNTLQGTKPTVTGWGATEDGPSNNILLQILSKVVSSQGCANTYKMPAGSSTKIICSGGGWDGKGACRGDSGGPLQDIGLLGGGAVGFIQYGVISFGPESCATVDRPVVYTRIGFYMKWILDTMKS